jgi:hypothetical protein
MWVFPEVIFLFLGIHVIIINIPGLILLIFIYLQTVNDKLKTYTLYKHQIYIFGTLFLI